MDFKPVKLCKMYLYFLTEAWCLDFVTSLGRNNSGYRMILNKANVCKLRKKKASKPIKHTKHPKSSRF